MADATEKKKSNYIEFWINSIGKKITIFTNDGKEFTGILRAVLISHMNIILEVADNYLVFRGHSIHHVAFPKSGGK